MISFVARLGRYSVVVAMGVAASVVDGAVPDRDMDDLVTEGVFVDLVPDFGWETQERG